MISTSTTLHPMHYSSPISDINIRCNDHCSCASCKVLEPMMITPKLKKDAIRRIGFFGLKKCVVGTTMLAHETTVYQWDEYLWLSERPCLKTMVRFATTVIKVSGRRT